MEDTANEEDSWKNRIKKFLEFKKQMSVQNIVFEKGDYLAMVLGAFWALWPALAITLAVIVGISLFFL